MILIVEDDPTNLRVYRRSVEKVQREAGYNLPIYTASTFEEAISFFTEERRNRGDIPLLVIVDMEIPYQGHKDPKVGFRLMEQLRLQFLETKWIPITAHVKLEQVTLDDGRCLRDALYTISSWGLYFKQRIGDLESMLRRFFASLDKEPKRRLQAIREEVNGEAFVTGDTGLYSEILSVAKDGRDVLLFGERGTGKRLIARLIHHRSDRQDAGFEVVEGSLDEEILRQELFPQREPEQAAEKQSVLDRVNNGTLYIRNFDQVPLSIQRRLQHFLKYKGYDVRLIGGILKSRREFDGYDRISPDFLDAMIPLDVPPLRERKEDIPILVELFLEQYNKRTGSQKDFVDRERIYELLQKQDWKPNNIKGLKNVVEEVLLKTPAPEITSEDFERVLETRAPQLPPSEPEVEIGEPVVRRASKPTRIITDEDIERLGL